MSHSPLRIVVIIILLLSESHYLTDALTNEQRREIESLRAELDDAFVKDEERTMKQHGVIVQPGWTQDHQTPHRIDSKVVVTNQGLNEAKRLRDEISKAIKQDSYTPIVGRGHYGADSHIVQELHKKYVSNENNRKSTSQIVANAAEIPNSLNSNGPNIIQASNFEPDIDIRKLQRLELNKRRSKESLILELIEEDFSFTLGEHVQEWEHILHGGQEYFIGRLEEDLQIVHKNKMQYEAGNLLHIGAPITYLETYSFWNTEKQQQEGIILVATGNKVLWYRSNEKSGEITLYWEWVVGNIISGLTYFTADSQDFLIISSNQSSLAGHYALNIYQFQLKNKEFWIAQRMQLAHPCNEVTFLNTGRDFILAIPQNNTALIYTFNPQTEATGHIRFQQKYKFESEGIEFITAFQMGGRSYLALGGMQPQILLYQQGKFIPKTIFGNNFGLVEFFFPIPVRTYRDDLILLVQHRVDFSTHKLAVLETLIWDGEAFEATIPAPCKLGEHTVYGVGCMLDIQRDAGVKGAALLRRGNEISIIVPRHQAESGLFRLHTKLLEKNSELMDLQEIFDFLKEWVAEQDKLIAEAQAFLAQPVDSTKPPDFNNLKLLQTPELFFDGPIKQLYVNDYKWTQQDSVTDLNYVIHEIEKLGDELEGNQRIRRDVDVEVDVDKKLKEPQTEFDELAVDDISAEILELENLNGKPFYIQNGELDFEGILNLVDLEVLENEHLGKERQTLIKELTVHQDLEFEQINGVPWKDIEENLVFRDKPVDLLKLEVEGEIIAENNVKVTKLNRLYFPDDYLFSKGIENQIVVAEKNFTTNLSAVFIDTLGYINGMDPIDMVTLSAPQIWTGSPTFKNLEVSETLELEGTARGAGLEDFPNNPTLSETRILNANCEFANLKVLGRIIVEENFNTEPLSTLFDDVVQRPVDPNEEIHIPSEKTFTEVSFPIDFHVLDESVNNIKIDEFITKHTTQNLNFTKVYGNCYFNNLTITGAYDGVLIDELLNNSIKINEPQFLPNTQLNFAEIITADSINVNKTINGVTIATELQTTDEDLKLSTAYFETLKIDEANVYNKITGNAQLNGIKLTNSSIENNDTETEVPIENIFIDELIIKDDLKVNEIHGINAEFLYNFLKTVDNLPDMILDGKVLVDHIIVTGDVHVNNLNGQHFDEDIQMTAIWLNRPNYLSTELQFVEPIDIQHDLVVLGDYNEQNLPDLIDDMVFQNPDGTVLILAPKNFVENIKVLENTKLDAVNGIPFKEIATKRNVGHFKGHLKINGNLYVQDLYVNGSLNGFYLSNISNQIYFDKKLHAFILPGLTNLTSPLYLQDLTVLGDLNEFKALNKFLESLVNRQGINLLTGHYNFTGRVSIQHGAYISNLNGHNLLDLFDNIVFINGLESIIIKSEINFMAPVKAIILNIHGTLTTQNLNGCDLDKWLNDTLRLDRPEIIKDPLRFEPNSLNGNKFNVGYLNNMDMSKVITLHTPQNLTDNLTFSEIYLNDNLLAKSTVNEVDLQTEYENTIFNQGNQHIKTPLKIQTINVLEDMQTKALVNGEKDLKDVAILYEDIEFESPLFFQKLKVKNVITNDSISGINFDEWYEQALWLNGREDQRITENWSVKDLSLINGPSMPAEVLGSTRKARESEESFSKLCKYLQKLWLKQSKKPYYVRHLKKAFEIDLEQNLKEDTVSGIFPINSEQENYLLVNMKCKTLILKWQKCRNEFEIIETFETGHLKEAFVILNDDISNDDLKLVTNSANDVNETCSITGLNIWKIIDNQLIHLKELNKNVNQTWLNKAQNMIFALTNDGLKQFSTMEPFEQKPLELDNPLEFLGYKFIAFDADSEMFFTNNTHILQITASNSTQLKRQRRSIPLRYSFFNNFPRSVHTLNSADESILKPNTTLIRKLNFADFSQVIERILEDLDYRLSVEVNITQLSIPETDLYDAHLIQDFIAIMEELRSQDIYPKDYFADINLENLKIPENPAQVLAARTVQIVWPVIVEINEVHRYLKGNSSKPHPISGCILSHLGIAIHEILIKANPLTDQEDIETSDYTENLTDVIHRIRKFQKDLVALKTELQIEIKEDLTAELENVIQIDGEKLNKTTTNSTDMAVRNFKEFNDQNLLQNFSLKVFEKLSLGHQENNEILKLEVSSEGNPLILIAVSDLKVQITPGLPSGINLYTDLFQNELFQFIPAYKPRFLTTLRIRDLTFLAFTEHCCLLNILQYRGVEGFVNFAKITTDSPIQHLKSVSLTKMNSEIGYYFAVVLKHKLVFYEIIIAGLNESSIRFLENCS